MQGPKPWIFAGAGLAVVAVAVVVVALVASRADARGVFDGVHVTVITSESCDCCGGWIAEFEANGGTAERVVSNDLVAAKHDRRVPSSVWSCHTAEVDGYVVEGHVPMDALERLLTERPAIDGIGLAGMPAGSPGMPGPQTDPFEVMAIHDGGVLPFGLY